MGLCSGKSGSVISKGTFRVLVLGISGSGKSTFAKQMKIIHTEGFTETERKSYCGILRTNIILGIKELSEEVFKDVDILQLNRKRIRYFREQNVLELDLCHEDILNKVKSIWDDPAVKDVWESSNKYQVQVSQMDYLMENIDRYVSTDFIPNDEDILRSRQRTSGAHSTRFNIDDYMWEIVDVGGQLPERAKWSRVLTSGVHAIIFFASLDEYNMESTEEVGKTKMEISLDVFHQVMLDEQTEDTSRLLFLNKSDLFKVKITSKQGFIEFNEKFPDFKNYFETGYFSELGDIEKREFESLGEKERIFKVALKFIENKFRSSVISDPENVAQVTFSQTMIVKYTCAVDTDHIGSVFDAIKDKIFLNRMLKSGIKF